MINLAGDADCDVHIAQELEQAGIQYIVSGAPFNDEVPSAIIGRHHGWTFRRAWRYWRARADDGLVLPFALADELYALDKSVRVAGHCGAPAPREWYKEPWRRGVSSYHIDTQEGLNLLAQFIRRTPPPDDA